MILTSNDLSRAELSRRVQRGELQRIAPGLYSDDTRSTPEQITGRDWAEIVERMLPGAVITYRSAFDMRPIDGELDVSHSRRDPLRLPGLTIRSDGAGRREADDIPLRPGLFAASAARALIDNSADQPGRPNTRIRRLDREQLHDRIVHLVQTTAPQRVDDLVEQVVGRANPAVGSGIRAFVRGARAEINTVDSPSRAMRSAQRGEGYDRTRVERFRSFAARLPDLHPIARRVTNPAIVAEAPFFEAYFSNYIEGTEFTVEEAERVVFDGEDFGRPSDAHDVLGTYQVVSSRQMRTLPADGDAFLEALRERHAVMMGARPEQRPGQWKDRNNRAGATEFVDHELVPGTLRAGWEEGQGLTDPFQRATYFMFLVSEVHPFQDGNGRSARVAMNNALVAADEQRIIIPTILRIDYLSSLTRATADGGPDGLYRVLDHAQSWVARGDWSTLESGLGYLARTNALLDAREAEQRRIYLEIPTWSAMASQDSAVESAAGQPRAKTSAASTAGSFAPKSNSKPNGRLPSE